MVGPFECGVCLELLVRTLIPFRLFNGPAHIFVHHGTAVEEHTGCVGSLERTWLRAICLCRSQSNTLESALTNPTDVDEPQDSSA